MSQSVEIPVTPAPVSDASGMVAAAIAAARRWGGVVVALGIIGMVLATLLVAGSGRQYAAQATLLLEPRYPHVLEMPTVRADEVHDELRYIRTQYEVLQSRSLAERVIRDEGLRHERTLGGRPASGETDWATLDPGLIDTYLGSLWVEPVPGTRLIHIGFVSSDPAVASRVANAHADAFVELGHRQWASANQAGLEFLRQRLVELRERLERSEAALNAYRWDTGIIALDDRENVVVEQLDGLIKRLSEAEAQRLTLEADVHALDANGPDALPNVVEHAGLHELAVHLALAEAEYAKAAARFKPGYPAVNELRRKVEALRARIASETRRVEAALRTEYSAAVEREAQMRTRLDEQKSRALKLKDESVQYAILNREVETNRQLYDSVLRRMKEMAVAADLRASNVSVVDRATVPTAPVGPAWLRTLGVAGVVGCLLGLLLAVGCETLDPSVKGPEQAVRLARVPLLGVVPEVAVGGLEPPLERSGPWAWLDRLRPSASAMPVSTLVLPGTAEPALADAYRAIRTAIMLARPDGAPRTLVVAGAHAGAGASTTAANLAAALARTDAAVVLVDADLRTPACERMLGLPGAVGLADVLTGRAHLDTALQRVPGDTLRLLAAGEIPANPSELIGSDEMRALLATLADRFDFVVVDAPPALVVSDAAVLGALADAVVVVARDRWTPRQALAKTRAVFAYARASLVGLVVNGAGETPDPAAVWQPIIRLRTAARPAGGRAGRHVA